MATFSLALLCGAVVNLNMRVSKEVAEGPKSAVLMGDSLSVAEEPSLRKAAADASLQQRAIQCDKSVSTNEAFWIAISAWNNPERLHLALQSVVSQEQVPYHKVHVVVEEDHSDRMFAQTDIDRYRDLQGKVVVTFLRNDRTITSFINNITMSAKQGSAFDKWSTFTYIRKHDVFVLDGDDTLADTKVLHDLYQQLHQHKPWFAWGRHEGLYSEQCQDLSGKPDSVRNAVWSFCHPRMFQSHLLQELQASDFQRNDGTWLQKATD